MARYFSEQTLLDMKYKDMNCVYDLSDLEEYLAGVPTADVVPRAEIAEIFAKIDECITRYRKDQWYTLADMRRDIQRLKTIYTEEGEK